MKIKKLRDKPINTSQNEEQGKPVIKGTRVTVELILRKLSPGNSPQMRPDITDINTVILFIRVKMKPKVTGFYMFLKRLFPAVG